MRGTQVRRQRLHLRLLHAIFSDVPLGRADHRRMRHWFSRKLQPQCPPFDAAREAKRQRGRKARAKASRLRAHAAAFIRGLAA